jgi:hypothetical protein
MPDRSRRATVCLVADPEVIGKAGRVIVRVRGADGPGEVLVRVRGGTEALIAFSDVVIERDAEVFVTHSHGERTVDVVPRSWVSNFSEADPTSPPTS